MGVVNCWDDYCYYPWPIQVNVQPAGSVWTWLGPVFLFLTSLVASGVAYLGIRKSNETSKKSNETSRDAIAAASDLEMVKWRRETLLKLSSEVASAAHDLTVEIRAAGRKPTESPTAAALDNFGTATRSIHVTSEHLRLIGAIGLADLSGEIPTALVAAIDGLEALSEAKTKLRRDFDEREAANPQAMSDELEGEWHNMERDYLTAPQATFDSAMKSVQHARDRFVVEASKIILGKNKANQAPN
jgi:hypothetical protein